MRILITGASSGIGAACARVFACDLRDRKLNDRDSLVLVARRKDRLEGLKSELESQYGVNTQIVALDVSSRKAVHDFAHKNSEWMKDVEILVNNAGLARGAAPFDQGAPEDWDEMIDTNIKGILNLTGVILPHMRGRGSGHIVNLGSVAGRWVYPNGNVYCATKAAVSAFSQGLRLDLNGSGVRVTEVCPGMVQTEFSDVRFRDASKAKAVYAGMTPLTADDVAETVLWCVNRPRHVNVQEVVIYPTDQASTSVVARRG